MNVIALILGVLALAYVGECATWTAPTTVPAGGGDAGEVVFLNQGATGTLYTVVVTGGTAFVMTSQTPAAAMEVATGTGIITAAAGTTLDYETAPTHVLVITATDGSGDESATITLVVNQLKYLAPNQCIQWRAPSVAGGTLATSFAIGATTMVHAQSSATTGYTYTIADGTIVNTAAVTAATTAATVTVVATATEAHGTGSTATTTVVICINGGCSCSTYGFSGSSALAAGILSVIMVLVMQLK